MLLAALCRNRRVHVFGRRVHHGLAGVVLAAAGLALMVDDIADAANWVRDFRRPR